MMKAIALVTEQVTMTAILSDFEGETVSTVYSACQKHDFQPDNYDIPVKGGRYMQVNRVEEISSKLLSIG